MVLDETVGGVGGGEEGEGGEVVLELRSSVRVYVGGLVVLGVCVGCGVVRRGRDSTARAVVKSFEEDMVVCWVFGLLRPFLLLLGTLLASMLAFK